MIWRINDIVTLTTFKLVLFLCLVQGYTKSEKEKLSEYKEILCRCLPMFKKSKGKESRCSTPSNVCYSTNLNNHDKVR